ncbi:MULTISPECIES: flavohemoglobin expression-modulating QEGLA motif protein [Sphingobacterium]|uniref:flavohemoglobin expression-modulating QEGLA motif protein n=1 Tax=Sphingobacterium TaxID=28453 RepID=UPI0021A77C56|nr:MULTISPECIES: flavohemoglobin expression-modulating QEGLA motif protein [Sphingobacterium]MCT1524358.1 flavohemoglobin expression-modulating QEGLA motif protein [Sphingobacterium hotanense]
MTEKNKPLQRILNAINKRSAIHYQIPNVGKFIFNKIVPYIFIYRVPELEKRDKMLVDLAKTENASIVCKSSGFPLEEWIRPIAQKLAEEFGACLLIEVWIADDKQKDDIEVHVAQKDLLTLAEYLEKNIRLEAPEIRVGIEKDQHIPHPPETKQLFSKKELQNKQILLMGISIKQNYLDEADNVLPLLMRIYRESLAKSLSRLFFEFLRVYTHLNATAQRINVHQELTPLMVEIDQALAQETKKFDFLLMVTPLNAHEAWLQFKKDKFWKTPKFLYRPMHVDPDLVKRRLYNLRIEDIYDPTMAYIFRDKRAELDSMITMLADRGKEDFLHGSLQVFGNVSEKLYNSALALLMMTEPEEVAKRSDDIISANDFAKMAREEIRYLQKQNTEFNSPVRVREDISGVMVNRGALNISQEYKLTRSRAMALIQHEIGTHVVTYFNGRQQPLNLFSLGVPGYEELQEGLAVLSEYIVNGLNNDRLRIIAARVIAVHHMLLGNTFTDTFDMLVDQYLFLPETAFNLTMRVYRGGGLTKDALYLKGIIELLNYIKEGNEVDLLMMGKIRKDYLPIIKDLLQRGVLIPPAIIPRYMSADYKPKWQEVTQKGSIFKLVE